MKQAWIKHSAKATLTLLAFVLMTAPLLKAQPPAATPSSTAAPTATPDATPSPPLTTPSAPSTPAFFPFGAPSFAPVVQKVEPSVVSIQTSKTIRIPRGLRDFFGLPGPGDTGRERQRGLGSGVIVSADGFILTNRHVVDAADEITVKLSDNREFKARRVGMDPGTDLAVLKIDATGLPVLTFANSDEARVGDIVLAVGTPFGLAQTVTMGIISGLGRSGMGIVDYENFIQTDASINPGNSGGALVDTSGKLLGINTAIFSRDGGNQGIGFAVPSNLARDVLESIRKNGRVIRGYLGVIIQPVTPELAKAFHLTATTGALVSDVGPNSPGEKAGLQHGDVITALNGRKVEGPRELRLMIGALAPSSKATLSLLRNGQAQELQVNLGELPQKQAEVNPDAEEAPGSSVLDGVRISPLDRGFRAELHTPPKLQGVVITDISPESAAYRAGLRQGFVLQEINRQPVATVADAERLALGIPKNPEPKAPQGTKEPPKAEESKTGVLVRAWSEGQSRYYTVGGETE